MGLRNAYRAAVDRTAMKIEAIRTRIPDDLDGPRADPLTDSSDALLAKVLSRRNTKPEARALAQDLKEAS